MKFNLERLREFSKLTRELMVGLRDLTFADNFRSFEVDVELAATTEVRVRNELGFIPERVIIVMQQGNGLVTKGDTEWTKDFLYMKNNGSVTVIVKLVFMR